MPALRAARMRAPVAQCTPRAARGEDPRGVCGVVNDVNDAGSYTCNPGASFPVTATCEKNWVYQCPPSQRASLCTGESGPALTTHAFP